MLACPKQGLNWKFDELCKIMRKQNMKHIAERGINSVYGRLKGSVFLVRIKHIVEWEYLE